MPHFHELGRAIRRARVKATLSQSPLARLLSLSPQALSQFESGELPIPSAALSKIARKLNISVESLIALKLKGLGRRVRAEVKASRRRK
jgi:transcriptional regulator with XRE-family HTH domain